ncbi:T9SS type A sorting domain-containing protein [Flavobacterium sp.]|uniref:T9SS type A sorting domain-containing protein n=1 Tax=Flavobacterium sp. TaxID=239 RepID=UPI003753A357
MKNYFIILFLLITASSFSQIALSRRNGTIINSGDIIAHNVIGYPDGELGFKVRNNGTASTTVKIRCELLVNNNGTNFELCFGEECLADIVQGQVYPSIPVVLNPNQVTGNFDHLLNDNTGAGVYPLDFKFKFFQVNASGSETGNAITLTYRYDPTLSLNEINQLQTAGVIVKSTVINDILDLDVMKSTNMKIYDLNGKIVKEQTLNYGVQSVDISDLASNIYILSFTSEGISTTQKIVVN